MMVFGFHGFYMGFTWVLPSFSTVCEVENHRFSWVTHVYHL